MVLSVSEFLLGRRLRSVLDIGCGEAPWAPILRKERPRLHYIGVDSSEYAVRKFGRRRNIHLGNFGDFDAAVPEGEFDLVVASDVIHYLTRGEFERGLPQLVARTGGIAYLDFFTSADNMEGDRKEMRLRSPGYYRRVFADAGFTQLGLQFYSTAQVARNLSALEHPH